ncbi:MAG TPA: FtsW/RodA/SpoVE family cell cycle protein [Anaerolineaceae bacterium]|nr:FtsW/RodA/SpoVE family cell cycle protein [Anaerolineaceae bacterium]
MSLFFPSPPFHKDQTQSRLLLLAAIFLFFYCAILTLSPAVRLHSWQVAYRWEHWIGFLVWLLGFAFIYHELNRRLPDHDPILLPVIALLTGWGLLSIWRLDNNFGLRQTIWLLVSLAIFWAGLRLPRLLSLLRRYKYIWLTSGLALTALTFFFGTYPGGSGPHLWLGCCGLYFQPSEPLKLLLVVYLAAYLADRLPMSFSFMTLLTPTILLIGAALAILLAQRDLGTGSLFILIYSAVIYLASGRKRMLLISGLIILATAVVGSFLFDVINLRMIAWLNPWLDPSGRSYQIVQSLIAVGSGGLLGSGPGLGSPGLVPVAQSDFIFASIAEETGFVGILGLAALLALAAERGLLIALRAPSLYQRYLASGVTTVLAAQSILIIGGNLRLLPLTGVTLPFVSYGGSSLLTSFLSLLILFLISSHPDEEPAPLPNPSPYLVVSAVLLVGFFATTLLGGWWSIIQANNLTTRVDNPRRTVTDRYVPRGAVLDRDNNPIMVTVGNPGTYTRQAIYPELGSIVGYTNSIYGQSGLEASLDPYLRGIKGNPASMIWWYQLLYSQPPPGLNVRLSIDLHLQQSADTLLGNNRGALVLLNASSGEILAMASHPSFNPNQLEQNWSQWINDPNSPFLDRATQGHYPIGAALGPFLLARVNEKASLPALPYNLSYPFNGKTWNCAVQPSAPLTWGKAVSNGCPGALVTLGTQLHESDFKDLYHNLGLDQTPDLPIPVANASPIPSFNPKDQASLGQSPISVSPLQMALAAASLSAKGYRPAPKLAISVLTPNEGWIIFPSGNPSQISGMSATQKTTVQMSSSSSSIWQIVASAYSQKNIITWYLAGTDQDWKGSPLALALVLEQDNPTLAQKIGSNLLNSTDQP